MSDPEYDPAVERAYRVPPEFADSALFDAEVAVRLENRWRWRRGLLTILGLVGAIFVMSRFVRLQVSSLRKEDLLSSILPRQEQSEVFGTIKQLSAQLGLADVSVGILSGPYLLILFGIAATIVLATLAVRLSKSL